MEDVAIASAIPNMRVLAPCDPEETRAATQWCVAQEQGPVYLRLGKAGEPVITGDAISPFEFGRLRYLREGSDACILGYGPILKMGIDAAVALEAKGISVSVASVHTLKPLDREGIANLLGRFSRIVVLEEMVPQGGLGDAIKAIAWDSGSSCSIRCLSLKHEFIHCYGGHGDLLAAHGLDVGAVVRALDVA
jgi:transketolase